MNHARRGGVYVIVLATSLMVFVLAYGAIAWSTADARARIPRRDETAARRLAASAVELAMQTAQNTRSWRTRAAASNLFTDLSTSNGFLTASATDTADGDLTNNTTDPVIFKGVGRVGSARQIYTVSATPSAAFCSALDFSLFADAKLNISSAILRASSGIATSGDVTVTSSVVRADVSAGGAVSGGLITGTTTTSAPARQLPDTDLFTQYAADGTAISYATLSGRIRRCVLSGATNPFGSVNARGIYTVNCGGGPLDIEDCRITGTLVITNTTGVRVRNSVYMSPWETGYPVLLVSGPLSIETAALDLIEASFQNFNPSGNPYNGVTDSDTADRYPSILQGIVYATGTLSLSNEVTLIGCLIGRGTVNVQSGAMVHLTRQLSGSPPGFVTRHFLVDTTTWTRQVE